MLYLFIGYAIPGVVVGLMLGFWLYEKLEPKINHKWYLKGYMDKELGVELEHDRLSSRVCVVTNKHLGR